MFCQKEGDLQQQKEGDLLDFEQQPRCDIMSSPHILVMECLRSAFLAPSTIGNGSSSASSNNPTLYCCDDP